MNQGIGRIKKKIREVNYWGYGEIKMIKLKICGYGGYNFMPSGKIWEKTSL